MSQVFTPHDYQRGGIIQPIREHKRCAIWSGMGTGKTGSTLKALLDLDHVEVVFPALVLAPKRVAQSTWIDEVRKWADMQHLRVVFVGGTARQREAALRVEADIYTMAYDNLAWLVEHLGDAWPFRTVVADELTRLKSFRLRQGSKRAGALGKVAHSKVERFIGLTGTPAANGISDLWGQMWFIDKGERLGRSFSAFEQRWFKKGFDGYSLVPFEHAQTEIESKLKDICFTVKGLPVDEPLVNDIYVDLPPDARRLYRDMEKHMFAEIAEKGVEAVNAAVRTSKCAQLASGSVIVEDDGAWEAVHDAKLDALESVIEEAAGMPVLVSHTFISERERILKRFRSARHLDGNPKTIAEWNAGNIPVLVANPMSAGHGLNLQDGGNILCFFSLTWNLEHYQQIVERIGPMRQKQSGYDRPVFVHHILSRDTIDEDMLERLATKRSVQDILLEAMERRRG